MATCMFEPYIITVVITKGSMYKCAHHITAGGSDSEERLQTSARPHRQASTVAYLGYSMRMARTPVNAYTVFSTCIYLLKHC